MDVQMPIIDGYRATHLIRHHAPYNISARNIPIVAMTASAIQGDREKCKKAGMDDYLSKPVKGKTLEKMLVRWAISRRTPRSPGAAYSEGSECSEPGEHSCGSTAVPMFGPERAGKMPGVREPPQVETDRPRPTMSERQNSQRLTLPGTENEGDRAGRREEAEEKATALRDEKMVDAASHHGERLLPPEKVPGQMLTVENMGKLEREVERGEGLRSPRSNASNGSNASGDEGKEKRPRMERRWMDSQRTITGNESTEDD
jgi:CheY-like chemotaxis protein